jgi:hypothetical protein
MTGGGCHLEFAGRKPDQPCLADSFQPVTFAHARRRRLMIHLVLQAFSPLALSLLGMARKIV